MEVGARGSPAALSSSSRVVRAAAATGANGGSGGRQILMWEALREAVDEEMERDPTVLVMGEDVGHYGGSYKVTYDLYKKYGEMRLLDTPISENSFAGMGIGAAMTGLRPIIEGMNMGFLLLAFNQISNNCGMLHYTSGGQYKGTIDQVKVARTATVPLDMDTSISAMSTLTKEHALLEKHVQCRW